VATAPSETTSVGTLLNGTYLLERVIAEGGMGVVYEAQHLRLPRKFAVKVLGKPKDASLASSALPRFRREAEIAATLSHPHIVEVFDFQVSEGGSPYIVMELLEGEDLAERVKRKGKIQVIAGLRIIREIAEALDVAHAGGVVHRDLKPANIFLSKRAERDDFVKVLDFGVSKLIDAATLTQEKAMVGTPLYMSPEQAVGTQELTPESDVFSLGSIAYEILTGRRAFAASSIPSILYQIVHGPTPTLAGKAQGIGPDVDVVFAKVLAKKKKDRFTRATQFSEALAEALGRDPKGDKAIEEMSARELGVPEGSGLHRAPEGSGLHRASTTQAPATEVDSSTRAQDLANAVSAPTPTPTPPLPLFTPPPAATKSNTSGSLSSLTGELLKTPTRWPIVIAVLVMGGLAAAGILTLTRPKPAPEVAPIAIAPPSIPVPAPEPKPVVTPLPVEAEHAPDVQPAKLEFAPDPVEQHGNVQFIFHVVPKNALVTVDDRRVVRSSISLPWKRVERRVHVTAVGYAPIAMTVPSTQSRTFELHMEKLSPKPAHVPPQHPQKVHDAAPVQDL
jgi:serine/threonine-protein kinase